MDNQPKQFDFLKAFNDFEVRQAKLQADANEQINKKIDSIQNQIQPIVSVYTSLIGAGKTGEWFFKYIIIPLGAILALMLNWRNIVK